MQTILRTGAVAGLLVLAAAPYLHVDGARLGILLTYTPRPVVAAAAAIAAGVFAARRFWTPSACSVIATILALGALSWGGGGAPMPAQRKVSPAARVWTLIAANIHNSAEAIAALRTIVSKEQVDFLVLQEVRLNRREEVRDAFGEFEFWSFDPPFGKKPASSGIYAGFTGVRRSLLFGPTNVTVRAAITGYRTFAIEIRGRDWRLSIVNVHATKPLWTENGWLTAVVRAGWSSGWHLSEARRLAEWIDAQTKTPLIVAGDFNAPHYAWAIRTLGLQEAHAAAGHGPHLTWPSWLPLMDPDHVLASPDVAFLDYRTVKLPGSDHRAQIVRFAIRKYVYVPVDEAGKNPS
ncbi:MAG: hypothetical protein D6760_05510 [Deltaproteobacteria bacterium]|nr:MAG: hypothetical protein D6760_05510 [Deltaproteobacteria bacterium]